MITLPEMYSLHQPVGRSLVSMSEQESTGHYTRTCVAVELCKAIRRGTVSFDGATRDRWNSLKIDSAPPSLLRGAIASTVINDAGNQPMSFAVDQAKYVGPAVIELAVP